MTTFRSFLPGILLAIGAIATVGVDAQKAVPLAAPLDDVIPREIAGYRAVDVLISKDEQRVAGMDRYLMRNYERSDTDQAPTAERPWFSVYIGYYEQQMQGKTIHSPKNCLPGSGWEPLKSTLAWVQVGADSTQVNRYFLQRGDESALVLYWYQGRDRIQWNEYAVKWNLLRDAALRGRSEEALVRIVIPLTEGEDAAFALARRVAEAVIPALGASLPM